MNFAFNIIKKELLTTWNPADIGSWKLFKAWKFLRQSLEEINLKKIVDCEFYGELEITRYIREMYLPSIYKICPPNNEREYTCRQLMQIENLPKDFPQELREVWIELKFWKNDFGSQEILLKTDNSK